MNGFIEPALPVTWRSCIDPRSDPETAARTHTEAFEAASWQFLGLLGLGPQRLRGARFRFIPLEERVTRTRAPAAPATLHIVSELVELGATTLRLRQTLIDSENGEPLATLHQHLALVDGAAGLPVAFPLATRRRAGVLFPLAARFGGTRPVLQAA